MKFEEWFKENAAIVYLVPPITAVEIAWREAIAAEREACAKECEEKHANGNWKNDTRDDCAAAIRNRGETK